MAQMWLVWMGLTNQAMLSTCQPEPGFEARPRLHHRERHLWNHRVRFLGVLNIVHLGNTVTSSRPSPTPAIISFRYLLVPLCVTDKLGTE